MLMFQNALMASFIPEIMMIIVYLCCLVSAPAKEPKQQEHAANEHFIQLVSSTSSIQSTTYHFEIPGNVSVNETIHIPFLFVEELGNGIITTPPSKGAFSSHYSRPPPSHYTSATII